MWEHYRRRHFADFSARISDVELTSNTVLYCWLKIQVLSARTKWFGDIRPYSGMTYIDYQGYFKYSYVLFLNAVSAFLVFVQTFVFMSELRKSKYILNTLSEFNCSVRTQFCIWAIIIVNFVKDGRKKRKLLSNWENMKIALITFKGTLCMCMCIFSFSFYNVFGFSVIDKVNRDIMNWWY